MMFLKTLTYFLLSVVIFAMDITQAALALHKEIKKIDLKLTDRRALSNQKRAQLNQRKQVLLAQLQAVLTKL